FRNIVDVGGGLGHLLDTILETSPESVGVLYDLPSVIQRAKECRRTYKAISRLRLEAGDFFSSVPAEGDLYILKWILHDWDDQQCVRILRNVARACAKHAKLLVAEWLMPDVVSPHTQ